ncbi:hypothetical protein KQX54_018634 [Cotesia glomerata]|uniref:Uncharacterized protein n=1 Tax=Cotesia glomerata TaxID=32391 RepID=A0AAV7IB64_COTGL|nr:hypothetical protein KQX54_018634 [Cotesia glomerata]
MTSNIQPNVCVAFQPRDKSDRVGAYLPGKASNKQSCPSSLVSGSFCPGTGVLCKNDQANGNRFAGRFVQLTIGFGLAVVDWDHFSGIDAVQQGARVTQDSEAEGGSGCWVVKDEARVTNQEHISW